jgi:hypothetical protein
VALLITAACTQDELLEKIASPEDRKNATECLDLVRAGDIAALEARIDPSLKAPDLHATLQNIADILPDGKPDSVTLVGANVNTNGDGRTANLTYQFGYGERWFMANCALKKTGNTLTILGISAQPLEKALQKASFDLGGKTPKHYAILVAGIVFVLISVFALIVCIMERGLRRKWAWILFIILGIGDLTLNWATGETTLSVATVQLFSASAVAEMYGAWMISIGLPLGAMWYLARRFLLNPRPADRSNPV